MIGRDGPNAHRLRRADQVALRAEVDRICLVVCRCSASCQSCRVWGRLTWWGYCPAWTWS